MKSSHTGKLVNKWMAAALLTGMMSTAAAGVAMAAEGGTLEAPEHAEWSSVDEMTARWDKVEDATGYQLRLYYNEEYIQTVHVKSNKADLSEYMMREGWYSYDVRAVAENKRGVKYMESSEYVEAEPQKIENLGDTDGRWKNYVDGRMYEREEGTLVCGQWYRIRGQWYYFGADGYMVTGWKQLDGKWYYLDEDGVMQTGWLETDHGRYYLHKDGAMATGWLMTSPGQWYYFNQDGSMAKDTIVDGYALNGAGIWIH